MRDGTLQAPRAKSAHCSWQGTIISLEIWLESGVGWTGEVWPAGTVTVNIWDPVKRELVRTMWFDNEAVFYASEPDHARLGLPPADYDDWTPGAWAPHLPHPAVRHL